MSWWDIFSSPLDIVKEAAFSRVFDGLIESRNAARSGFQELENAKARLAEFYTQFTVLPASQERSEYRRLYQDTLSELDAGEKRLKALSTDLAVVQEAASAAHAGKIPYQMINDQVAVAGINTRGLEPADIEAGERRLAGIGAWPAAIVTLIVAAYAITAACLMIYHAAVESVRLIMAKRENVDKTALELGVTPSSVQAPTITSSVADVAKVSVLTFAVVGGVLYWLLGRRV